MDQCRRLGLGRIFGQYAVIERQLAVLAFNGQLPRHLEETEHVQVDLAGGASDGTLCAIQRDFDIAARAGGHRQSGQSLAVFIARIAQPKVNYGIACLAGAVDFHQQVGALGNNAINAH